MKCLAIETATDVCAVALTENGRAVGDLRLHQHKIHNEKLINAIDMVHAAAGWQLKDLQGIALSIGPGSFTGLRIGISVAKGLAFALDVPLATVNTLDAFAFRARRWERIAVVMKVRQNEVYLSRYAATRDGIEPLAECMIVNMNDLPSYLHSEFLLIESPAKLVSSRLALDCRIAEAELCTADPIGIAKLGTDKLTKGDFSDPATLEPFYLKEFEPKRKKYYAENAA